MTEGSIGSNLRRIEAVTGTSAIDLLRAEQAVVDEAASLVGVPRNDVVDGVAKRMAELKAARDEIKALKAKLALGQAGELAADARDGVVIARVDGVGRDELKDLAVAVRGHDGIRAVVLGGAPDGGGAALVAVADPASGLQAGALLADAAKAIKGGGGKGAELAMAGGKEPAGIDEGLALAAGRGRSRALSDDTPPPLDSRPAAGASSRARPRIAPHRGCDLRRRQDGGDPARHRAPSR